MGFWHSFFGNHRGPRVKVEPVFISKVAGVTNMEIGWNTRVFCKCSTCGKLYEAVSKPGKWTLEELNNL